MAKKYWYSIPGGILTSLPQTNWYDWFAWHPVRLTEGKGKGQCAWWEWIQRKTKMRTYDDDELYRLPKGRL